MHVSLGLKHRSAASTNCRCSRILVENKSREETFSQSRNELRSRISLRWNKRRNKITTQRKSLWLPMDTKRDKGWLWTTWATGHGLTCSHLTHKHTLCRMHFTTWHKHQITHTSPHRRANTHTQPVWCALRTELVGITLFLSPAAYRRRGAGSVGPNALKIELARRLSWGLKYKSMFPAVSWSWPPFSGACRDGRLCHR